VILRPIDILSHILKCSIVSVRVKNVTGVLMEEEMSEGRCISEDELAVFVFAFSNVFVTVFL